MCVIFAIEVVRYKYILVIFLSKCACTFLNYSNSETNQGLHSRGNLDDSLELRLALQIFDEVLGSLALLAVTSCLHVGSSGGLQLAVSVQQSLVEHSFHLIILVNKILWWCRNLAQAHGD